MRVEEEVSNLDVVRLENYLRFHLTEIQEELGIDAQSESDGMYCAKWGSAATVLKEFLLRSHEEITSALARIQKGTYGNCVGCGNKINPKRLQVVPWSELCIVCQEQCDHWSAEHARKPERHEIKSAG